MSDQDSFVAAVRTHVQKLQRGEVESEDARSLEHPPFTEGTIAAIEERFGYPLPPAVRALYTRLANGGFGPAYGLLGLRGGPRQEDGADALDQYESYRRRGVGPDGQWPGGLLPIVHLGCAMFFCVDCTTPEGNMVWFEPNAHDWVSGSWTQCFIPLPMTFEQLMRAWVAGTTDVEIMDAASGSDPDAPPRQGR
jgi:hypothetical protein